MTSVPLAGRSWGVYATPEFELLSRIRERCVSRQLADLPGLFLLSQVASVWGVPVLRAFYCGDPSEFGYIADLAQRMNLFSIVVMLLALKLQPRALQLFLMWLIFMVFFAGVWL